MIHQHSVPTHRRHFSREGLRLHNPYEILRDPARVRDVHTGNLNVHSRLLGDADPDDTPARPGDAAILPPVQLLILHTVSHAGQSGTPPFSRRMMKVVGMPAAVFPRPGSHRHVLAEPTRSGRD